MWNMVEPICGGPGVPGLRSLFREPLSQSVILGTGFNALLKIPHLIPHVQGEPNWIFNPWLTTAHWA